nr:TorF family putative porin [Caulobacter sp. S45]
MSTCRSLISNTWSSSARIFIFISSIISLQLIKPTDARAQLGASATVESQYNVRGVSLNDAKPDIRFGLTYDHASGAYGGLSGILGDTARNGVQPLGYIAYLGFAKPLPNGWIWDVGATNTQITLYIPASTLLRSPQNTTYKQASTERYRADYSEFYSGVSVHDISARVYISPDYLNQGVSTAYLDLNAAYRPIPQLRLYGHAGALTPLDSSKGAESDREHFDLGAGAVWELHHAELRLAWTGVTSKVEYPINFRQKNNALILSATGFF